MENKEARPRGLNRLALAALAVIATLFGGGCSRIHGGYVRGTIPSQADLEKRVQDASAPLTDSERDHFAGLVIGTSIEAGVCQRGDTYLRCRERLQGIETHARNTLLCTVACGENSPLLTLCIRNDVPTAHPEMGTSITCDAAVAATMTDAQLEVTRTRDRVADATREIEAARNLAETQRLAAEGQRDAERRRAEDAEHALETLRAQQATPTPPPVADPPTVAIAPETPRRHHGHGAHHSGGHRRTRAVVSAHNPAPASELTLDVEGMGCTACIAHGGGTACTVLCQVRAHTQDSAGFLARVLRRHAQLVQGPGTMPGLDHLALRLRRHRRVIERIITDNSGSTRECASQIILAAPASDHSPTHPHYFRRRVGVCSAANGNATPVTLESFIAAATAAGAQADHVVVWGHTGGYVRLRFREDPQTTPYDEPPAGGADRSAQSPLTPRHTNRALAALSPAPRLNARYAEVTARTGTVTPGLSASWFPVATIAWWFDPRWRYWRPTALA